MKNNTCGKSQCSLVLASITLRVLTALALLTWVSAAWAQRNPNPRVLPPNSVPYGKTYAEWGAAWWQWALSIPAARNPVSDHTGQFCDQGQSGPVWFLAGTFGFSTERSCTVPAGKALFFPLVNRISGAGVGSCEPTKPGVACDVDAFIRSALDFLARVDILEAEVDGVPLQDLAQYVALSTPFAVTLPSGAVFGLPAGKFAPHIASGYWLMLAPLPSGQHTIRFRGGITGSFDVHVTYLLTVLPTTAHTSEDMQRETSTTLE